MRKIVRLSHPLWWVAYQSEKTNVKRKSQETQFCHHLSSVCLISSTSECHYCMILLTSWCLHRNQSPRHNTAEYHWRTNGIACCAYVEWHREEWCMCRRLWAPGQTPEEHHRQAQRGQTRYCLWKRTVYCLEDRTPACSKTDPDWPT